MSKRLEAGWKLYQKRRVQLDFMDSEFLRFKVRSEINHKEKEYEVTIYQDRALCTCTDYSMRWQRGEGSFICKHLHAAFFELSRIRGVNDQSTFSTDGEYNLGGCTD